MKEIIALLLAAFAGLVLAIENENASYENVVKRDSYPFMAFLYYPDDSVVDLEGIKFMKSAVLIRPNWLISSNIENANTSNGFPEKTLVARLGTISIDTNFTLNEDENEQEREIIQIVRPYNFNATFWWYNDISFLKTLLPFNITPSVSVVPRISYKNDLFNMTCYILLYVHTGNETDKNLVRTSVDILPASSDICGSSFNNESMYCATPSDQEFSVFNYPNFCKGNGGGPLLCDNELSGIQTYVHDCKQPYLYQRLSAWKNLLSCAIEEKCLEEQCTAICFLINKDPISTTPPMTSMMSTSSKIRSDYEDSNLLADGSTNRSSTEVSTSPTLTTTEPTGEKDVTTATKLIVTRSTHITMYPTSTNTSSIISTNTIKVVEDILILAPEKGDSELESEVVVRKANVEARHNLKQHNDASFNLVYSLSYLTSIFLLILLY